MPGRKNNGPKNQPASPKAASSPKNALIQNPTQTSSPTALGSADFRRTRQVSQHVGSLLAQCQASEAAAALVPWFCDALPSAKSRKDYYADIRAFLTAMGERGIHPFRIAWHLRAVRQEGPGPPGPLATGR